MSSTKLELDIVERLTRMDAKQDEILRDIEEIRAEVETLKKWRLAAVALLAVLSSGAGVATSPIAQKLTQLLQ